MKNILCNPEFDYEKDIDILYYDKGKGSDNPFTTKNTLIALEYNAKDVVKELKGLEISNYIGSVIDNKGIGYKDFFVFIKSMKKRDVYIKIKIRDNNKQIFCVSFHFDEFEGTHWFPYM